VSDQPTHYVLSDAPCAWAEHGFNLCDKEPGEDLSCFYCVGDGRRLDVESRVAVEAEVLFDGDVFDNWPRGAAVDCWVPGTTEETP
jgi:hypothetical protein